MKLSVKVRLNSQKQKFESVGNYKYIVSLLSSTHEEANEELLDLLSKQMGTPRQRIYLLNGEESDLKNFQIE